MSDPHTSKGDRGTDASPRPDIHVTGVSGSGTATTSTAIGLQDNRTSGVAIHVNVTLSPETTSSREIFNNLNPCRTDHPSSDNAKANIQFEKTESQRHFSPSEKIHTCPGRKKPCGAVLRLNQNFCSQCKWKIDKTIFSKERKICKGIKADGSICSANIQEGSRFCSTCGEDVVEDPSPVVFTCSGMTSEGVACDHSSLSSFDICPKCRSNAKPIGIRKEISCPGEKHPCGAKLTIEDNFCPHCKWGVKKELFDSKSKCNGLTENGYLCLALIMEGDRFCSKCGNNIPEDSPSFGQSIKLRSDPPFLIPDQVKTSWELSNVKIGDYLIALMHFGQQVAIKSFFLVIYQKYKAILSEVSVGSLVFIFLHEDEERAQHMMDDRKTVIKLIEEFLEELDDSVLYDHLDLSVKLVTNTEKTEAGLSTCEMKDEADFSLPPSTPTNEMTTQEESEDEHLLISAESIGTACKDGNLQLVKDIISVSPETVNIPSEHGDTPLMWASLGGHYDVVKVLLSHKADVNVKNNRGETSLLMACRKSLLHKTLGREKERDITVFGCILAVDQHVSVDKTSDDNEIYTNIVELLLSHGADENVVDDDGFTPLLLTCIFGDLEVTELLLSRGANVNYTGILGSTALIWACVIGHDNIVDRLIQAGANVNITTNMNISALIISSLFGREKIVDKLISHGANVDKADDKEYTPLDYAALFGFLNVVNLLISHGARIDKRDCNDSTPLMVASTSGQSGVVETLISLGGDVNHQDTYGMTPLMWSAMVGHTDTVRLLLSHGAKIDTRDVDGWTALMFACIGGWDDVLELLLSNGADVNVTDENGHTPLTLVCSNVQNIYELYFDDDDDVDLEIFFFFPHNKSKPQSLEYHLNQLKAVCSDRTQSYMLGFAHLTGDTDLLLLLQRVFSEHHTDTPSVTTDDGDTRYDRVLKMLLFRVAKKDVDSALLVACNVGYESGVRLLIQHGADVNIQNENDGTALSIASREGLSDIVELLLDHKADVNAKGCDWDTPLIKASREGHDTVVEKLLRHGADVNAKGSDGDTPLIEASRGGHNAVVEILLRHGADDTITNNYGETAATVVEGGSQDVNMRRHNGDTLLIEASRDRDESTVRKLLERDADVNACNMYGDTALSVASRQGHSDIVELLCKHKANVNVQESYIQIPLIDASREGHVTVVEILLRHGADVKVSNNEGETAVTVALDEGHDSVVDILLNPHAYTNTGETVTHDPYMKTDPRLECSADTSKEGAKLREKEKVDKHRTDGNVSSSSIETRKKKNKRDIPRKKRKGFRWHRGKGLKEDDQRKPTGAAEPEEIISRSLYKMSLLSVFKRDNL